VTARYWIFERHILLRATDTGAASDSYWSSHNYWSRGASDSQILELQTTDTGAHHAGATDTGAYKSKLQKLLELRVTDRPGGAKGSTVELL